MGLAFYDSSKQEITSSNVLIESFNGTFGESVEVMCYVHNDDINYYYTNITVWAEDSQLPDKTLGVYGNGYGVKLSAGARQPTVEEWENILAGDTISISNIGTTSLADITSYKPFWIKITVPGGLQADNITSLSLEAQCAENVIGA